MRKFEFIAENSAPVTQKKSIGAGIKELIANEKTLPENHPLRKFSQELLGVVAQVINTAKNIKTESAVSAVDIQSLNQFGEAYMTAALAQVSKVDPESYNKIMTLIGLTNAKYKAENSPEVKKAATAAIKGIQLNARAEIGELDSDIESMAQKFVTEFGVKPVWARNIVGMFGINIDRKDRQQFLQACLKGEALDLNKMVTMGEGSIEDVVTTEIPKVKEVFKSVKDTLLDISLSTGQRGATGPFEALLAIMGGARKPGAGEGGDVKFPNGKKFEVKSTSLQPSSKLTKDGTLPAYGGASAAWLDSTPGGEISGAVLRQVGTEWISSQSFRSPDLATAWQSADFRLKGLASLNQVLDIINKKDRSNGQNLIKHMMSKMFPSITTLKSYDLDANVAAIETAIRGNNPRGIAKIQSIMALLEYHLGKGNDGFIFFNSSTQEFKIFEGVEGIMAFAKDSSNVQFVSPMTMGKSQKASPGLYYGPDPTSAVAKKYFKKFNSDPERVQRYVEAQQAKSRDLESSTGFN